MFFTWLILTIIGVVLTYVSLILSIGIGHGGPAPAALPFFVGLATLILPYLVASQMKQSKDNQYKDIADEEELGGV